MDYMRKHLFKSHHLIVLYKVAFSVYYKQIRNHMNPAKVNETIYKACKLKDCIQVTEIHSPINWLREVILSFNSDVWIPLANNPHVLLKHPPVPSGYTAKKEIFPLSVLNVSRLKVKESLKIIIRLKLFHNSSQLMTDPRQWIQRRVFFFHLINFVYLCSQQINQLVKHHTS